MLLYFLADKCRDAGTRISVHAGEHLSVHSELLRRRGEGDPDDLASTLGGEHVLYPYRGTDDTAPRP